MRLTTFGAWHNENVQSVATQDAADSTQRTAWNHVSRPVPATEPVGSVVDLFCGVGGLSHGFRLEGFSIACGYDIDGDCRYPFEQNNGAPFVSSDVARIDPSEVGQRFDPHLPKILAGCAPCQPFSSYSRGRGKPQWSLLNDFARLAEAVEPDIVTMENVPQLVRFRGGAGFSEFVEALRKSGYSVKHGIVRCTDFGIPQSRSRLVLIGSKLGEPALPQATHAPSECPTVRDVIGDLPALGAGHADKDDPIHRTSIMSDLNLRRIRASRPGGTWRDWPTDLVAECHRKDAGRQYFAVYGRMEWDQPAPTITTQFHGFGNGRFGHPEQDRALSIREGALLQTFPRNYAFVPRGEAIRITALGRMIGNAVPVALGRVIARSIKAHLAGGHA